MKRGFTLIEAMIAVALLGISGLIAGQTASSLRAQAIEVVQWERAQQVLEHEASSLIHGRQPDPAVRRALLEALPGGKLERKFNFDGLALIVSWRSPRGPTQRELYLVGKVR